MTHTALLYSQEEEVFLPVLFLGQGEAGCGPV